MKTLSVQEIRDAMENIDQMLADEGELIVTEQGRPVARILPIHQIRRMPLHASLRAQMPQMKRDSAELVREDRDGR